MAKKRQKRSVSERNIAKEEAFYADLDKIKDEEVEEDEETKKEAEEEFDLGLQKKDKNNDDIYTEEGLEDELEDEEISDWEEGFMRGEVEASRMVECYLCAKLLNKNDDDIYIRDDELGERRYYCSEECLEQDSSEE